MGMRPHPDSNALLRLFFCLTHVVEPQHTSESSTQGWSWLCMGQQRSDSFDTDSSSVEWDGCTIVRMSCKIRSTGRHPPTQHLRRFDGAGAYPHKHMSQGSMFRTFPRSL